MTERTDGSTNSENARQVLQGGEEQAERFRRELSRQAVGFGKPVDVTPEPSKPRKSDGFSVEQWIRLSRIVGSFETLEGPIDPEGPTVQLHVCRDANGLATPLIAFDGMAIVDTSSGSEHVGDLRARMEETGGSATTIFSGEGDDHTEAWTIPGLTLAEVTAMAEAEGSGVYPNLIYFPRSGSFVFHPGSAPVPQLPDTRRTNPVGVPLGMVVTVDTGDTDEVGGTFVRSRPDRMDPYPSSEMVHGHGPAIADLIGRLVGAPEQSVLIGIDHSKGALGLPMFNTALDVRGFDLVSLLGTLSEVDGHRPVTVNFSFGTLQCPNMAGPNDPLFRWLKLRERRFNVAVAAGNHGAIQGMADVPSWPAAYARPGNPNIELSNVVSVGSRTPRGQKSRFSGKGSTITGYAPGESVVVLRAGSNQQGGGKYALWTGTSFATPQIAAEMACGMTKGDVEATFGIP